MDVMKRVDDLMNKALGEGSTDNERLSSALGALRLIREYKLLGKKHVDVAVDILDRFTSPDFMEGVATRAEKFADTVGRVMGVAKKVAGATRDSGARVGEERLSRRRRSRRY